MIFRRNMQQKTEEVTQKSTNNTYFQNQSMSNMLDHIVNYFEGAKKVEGRPIIIIDEAMNDHTHKVQLTINFEKCRNAEQMSAILVDKIDKFISLYKKYDSLDKDWHISKLEKGLSKFLEKEGHYLSNFYDKQESILIVDTSIQKITVSSKNQKALEYVAPTFLKNNYGAYKICKTQLVTDIVNDIIQKSRKYSDEEFEISLSTKGTPNAINQSHIIKNGEIDGVSSYEEILDGFGNLSFEEKWNLAEQKYNEKNGITQEHVDFLDDKWQYDDSSDLDR